MFAAIFKRITVFALLLICVFPAGAQETRAIPPNDNFANRIVVTARGVMNADYTVATAQDASIQSGEPVPSCAVGSIFDSVWYEFTAPHTIDFSMHTFDSALISSGGANQDTVVALYSSTLTSPAVTNLSQVACGQSGTGAASLSWSRHPAGRYFLQVASENALTGTSTFDVEFGSRYQLLVNTNFGEASPVLAPWTVSGSGTTGDKVVCLDLRAFNCHFRFKTSATEGSLLQYKLKNLGSLPHNTSPTNYSEFVLSIDYESTRSVTGATAAVQVWFSDGTKDKAVRNLEASGAIFVDPINGKTPTKAKVKIYHGGKSGAALYILNVELYYVPGATGRSTGSDVLPMP